MSRIYRATFMCSTPEGALIEPTLHYQTDVPLEGEEPAPDDVAGGIWTLLGTAFKACTPVRDTIHTLVVSEEVLKPDIGVAGSHTVEQVGTLGGTGDSIPEALVPLVNIHTGTRSRNSRGWVHLPSPHWADNISYNQWTPGFQTTLQTFADLLDNSFDLGTIIVTHVHPVVYSRTRRKAGTPPWTFNVTQGKVNTQPKFLRSRYSVP